MVKKSEKGILITDLKPFYQETINLAFQQLSEKEIDENDTISLFHGTSTYYLNEIIKKGLLPRKDTGNNNWESNPSFMGLTYLTNKWQYMYAYSAVKSLYKKENITTYPCYVEFKVPKAMLAPDEDLINSKYMVDRGK